MHTPSIGARIAGQKVIPLLKTENCPQLTQELQAPDNFRDPAETPA